MSAFFRGRHDQEKHKLGEALFATVDKVLQLRGLKVGTGTKREGTARADGILTSVQERDLCWMRTNKTDKAAALGVSLDRRSGPVQGAQPVR